MDHLTNSFNDLTLTDFTSLCKAFDNLYIGEGDTMEHMCNQIIDMNLTPVCKFTALQLLQLEKHAEEFKKKIATPRFKKRIKNKLIDLWRVHQVDTFSFHSGFVPHWQDSY